MPQGEEGAQTLMDSCVLDTNVVISGVFLEVAAASEGKILVTGNVKHYPPASRGPVRVLTPAEAWAEFAR